MGSHGAAPQRAGLADTRNARVACRFAPRARRRPICCAAATPRAGAPSSSPAQASPALDTAAGSADGMRANFIKTIVQNDISSGKHTAIKTRFPPEPNGFLHLGHAKSICLNFGLAKEFGGTTNLRFDDTNPEKEDERYVQSIMTDVHWLAGDQHLDPLQGKEPWDGLFYASDYFEQMYACAEELVQAGKAFVCELTPEQMGEYRGTLTTPGRSSPSRDRPPSESLELLRRMRAGEIPEATMTLRAKIDMTSSNMCMRDPALYRVRHIPHQRTGDAWCIYPMYDFAHCLSDALEGITHSLCTLEFAEHRALYDWILDHTSVGARCHPRQIEFSRLNIQYTVLSKRKLITLVESGVVDGWDDPRMPTISGMRRRGYTPSALRLFAERVGVSKTESNIDMSVLEDSVRADLEDVAPRAFAVLEPIKLVITNWPEGEVEWFEVLVHPKRPEMGVRRVPFSGEVYIDSSDFMQEPPNKKYFRLAPDRPVRLKFAYVVHCDDVVTDACGQIVELLCTYNPETRAGNTPDGMKKVKGIIQWVSCAHGVPITVRKYDRLFSTPWPGKERPDGDFLKDLNPDSLEVAQGFAEPSLFDTASAQHNDTPKLPYQFERVGYFFEDASSTLENVVFNRVVTLRDTWAQKDDSQS
ncbi:Glutamine--tRNA ligase [Porphyridium purpureum]|uniref:glutamine--tRNA ligase n=1 Tax=Porphyridium purpureum TaxID=35688 RepID=A0A5J4YI47_PORPP|nr:Glutamine--tRNA ligase [Porphyridium purpureum]|eukprot:POR0922..scf289_17